MIRKGNYILRQKPAESLTTFDEMMSRMVSACFALIIAYPIWRTVDSVPPAWRQWLVVVPLGWLVWIFVREWPRAD